MNKIMKKYQSILSLMLGLFVGLTTITACSSSDDESDNGGDEKPSINKRLVKETEESEGSISVNEYTYDNDGKVIQVKYNITYRGSLSQNKPRSGTYNITYSDNSILEVSSNGDKREYTLENGLIVKYSYSSSTESWADSFTYDSNNHLITRKSTNSQDKYIWSGGNFVRREGHTNNRNDVTTYEYSSYLSPPNFHKIPSVGSGYVTHAGETSKNLPSKITRTNTDRGEILVEDSCEWVIENGLPVKAIVIHFEKSRYSTYTITYEWK